jgi:hypothetical protein
MGDFFSAGEGWPGVKSGSRRVKPVLAHSGAEDRASPAE